MWAPLFFLFSAGVIVGALVGLNANRRTIEKQRRTIRALRAGSGAAERPRVESSKKAMWICLAMGISWVWCSYILAWMGATQIAESLSSTAVKEIIGVFLVYCAKSVFENLSKNNTWPDKTKQADGPGAQPDREEPPDVGM